MTSIKNKKTKRSRRPENKGLNEICFLRIPRKMGLQLARRDQPPEGFVSQQEDQNLVQIPSRLAFGNRPAPELMATNLVLNLHNVPPLLPTLHNNKGSFPLRHLRGRRRGKFGHFAVSPFNPPPPRPRASQPQTPTPTVFLPFHPPPPAQPHTQKRTVMTFSSAID